MNKQVKKPKYKRKSKGPSEALLLALMGIVILSIVLLLSTKIKKNKTSQDESNPQARYALDFSAFETNTQRINDQLVNIRKSIMQMTLEEKVAQLFIVTPETLGDDTRYFSETGRLNYTKYPLGGFVIMPPNLESPEQLRQLLEDLRGFAKENNMPLPFLAIDEEGGDVARIANHQNFGIANVGSMRAIGDTGDISIARAAGSSIARYLAPYGFNVDFAPVADVLSNPENTVIGDRSFGEDPQWVADMTTAFITGIQEHGLGTCVKHFPGHGATSADTHDGFAVSYRTKQELLNSELLPFIEAMDVGVDFVMIGHFSVPQLGDNLPASLSKAVVTDLLKNTLHYNGLAITDAMNMGAISANYSSGDAAVMAIQAGCDIVLMPEDFYAAFDAVLIAVQNGSITEAQINQSVAKILKLKERLGNY